MAVRNSTRILAHRKLLDQLRKWFNPQVVEISGYVGQGLTLKFANGFIVLILPGGAERTVAYGCAGLLVIPDPGFKLVRQALSKGISELAVADASYSLAPVFEAFARKIPRDRRQEAALKLGDFELRDLWFKTFKQGPEPAREYFLFGDDELRPRFSGFHPVPEVPPQGLRVRIADTSALLMTTTRGRTIDLHTTGYQTDKFIYVGDVYTYRRCRKKPGCIVSHNPKTGKMTYQEMVLKPGVDLSLAQKIPYQEVDGQEYRLQQRANGRYFLIDEHGEIGIGHPDLLVYILD